MDKICKNCGSPMPAEAKFCTECGNSEFVGQAAEPVDALREAGDSSLALGMTGAQQAGDALRGAGDNAAYGGYTSSVTGAGAPATPSPQGEGFAQQPYGQQQYQQPYGQQQYQQPYGQQQYPQQQSNAAFGGCTSSDANAGAFAPPSPQGEGFAQPYGQPYGVPYGAPYGAPAPKKSKKGMWIAIIAIILVLGLAAVALFVWPGFLTGKKSVDGEWVNDRSGFTVEFKGDKATVRNDVSEDATEYSVARDGDKLKLTSGDDVLEYIFKVVGDALTLYYQEDGVSFPEAYTRKGAETPAGREIVGRWASDSVKDFIVDDGAITEISYDDVKTTYTYEIEDNKLKVTPDDAASEPFVRTFEVVDGRFKLYDEDGEETMNFRQKGGSELAQKAVYGDLIGTWDNGYGGEIVIDGDRLRGANGRDYSLKLEGDIFTVYVPDSDDTESYRYELDGDVLKLYNVDSGELEATLTRKGGSGTESGFDSAIVGSWVDQVGTKLVIGEDGSAEFDGKGVTLTAKDGRMVWTNDNDGASYNYTYKLEDGKLIIHDPNENVTWTYTRDEAKTAGTVDPYLLGYWKDDDGDLLTIYANGTATYIDDEIIYISAENGRMVWTEGGVSETYTYTLNGDFMTLYDEYGAGFDFHRASAETEADTLDGTWYTDGGGRVDINGSTYTTADGTQYVMEINGDVMRLYIPQSEEDYYMHFKQEGDTLTFYDDNGNVTIVYHRD